MKPEEIHFNGLFCFYSSPSFLREGFSLPAGKAGMS
jgi:hypothetical protein